MSLSKKELMLQMWIPVTNRFPDPAVHKNILVFHQQTGIVRQPLSICIADDIEYTKDIMSGQRRRPKDTISGCEFTHWMPIYTPPII